MNGDFIAKFSTFEDASNLKDAILKEIEQSDISLDGFKMGELKDFSFDPAILVRIVAKVDSSKDVREAMFKCLGRCSYNGQKVTAQTFDNPEVIEDYYEILIECLKVNLTPFFKGLISKLSSADITEVITTKIQKAQM